MPIPPGAGIIGARLIGRLDAIVSPRRQSFQALPPAGTFSRRELGAAAATPLPPRRRTADNIRLTLYWLTSTQPTGRASGMRNLTVYQRFAMIIAALTIVLLRRLRPADPGAARCDARRAAHHSPRPCRGRRPKILAHYEGEAKAGRIEPDRGAPDGLRLDQRHALGRVFGLCRRLRHGQLGCGVTYVHANPKYINVNRWDFKDKSGKLLIQDIVRTARAGGGFVEYPRARGRPAATNCRNILCRGLWYGRQGCWRFRPGAYVDDIDAVVFRRMIWAGIAGLAGLAIAAFAAFWLGRGLVVPLNRTCATMDELVKGNLAVDVPFVDQTNEVGRIARSLQVFKDHLVETTRLRTEQEAMKTRSAEERRADLDPYCR